VYGFRIQLIQQSISKPTRKINSKKADEENRYFIQLYDQGAGLVPNLLLTPFPVKIGTQSIDPIIYLISPDFHSS
jgi:hypothetical protein